ncbi:MAG: formylglycine-generating enzyme family protein [Anaerolineales bacterium]|nr:formylglycine-generating enzyme family protein [Anaerolineales bacterium]
MTPVPDKTINFPIIRRTYPIGFPNPKDKSIGQSLNAILSWLPMDSRLSGARYTVLLEANDSTPDVVIAQDYYGAALDTFTFTENTQYYWQVIGTTASGVRHASEVWTFRTDVFAYPPDVDAMVSVPAGEFTMGCDPKHSGFTCLFNQNPLHKVYLDSFKIDKFEVTNREYRACMDAGACQPPRKSTNDRNKPYFFEPKFDYYPVMFVSNWDAQDFCAWESKRLPTEAEWEKAARGTIDTRPWPWGYEGWDCGRVNRCSEAPAQVDDYHGNQSPYGAVNMSGNIFEWVQDYFYDFYYWQSPYKNPVNQVQPGPIPYFTIRGGSYHDNWWYARINHRAGGHHGDTPGDDAPYFRSYRVGFRCASALTAAEVDNYPQPSVNPMPLSP